MNDQRFRKFIIVSLIVLSALLGYGIQRVETQHSALGSAITQQAIDREAAVLKNVQARKSDCENGNVVRLALRENIEQGKRELPIILKLVPSLNTKQILKLSEKSNKRQLKAFASVDCTKYALEAAPKSEQHKLTLEEQQSELKATQRQLHETVLKSAETRITTVTQRCELTGLIDQVLIKQDPSVAPRFTQSYRGCEKQLTQVKKIAAQAKLGK